MTSNVEIGTKILLSVRKTNHSGYSPLGFPSTASFWISSDRLCNATYDLSIVKIQPISTIVIYDRLGPAFIY